MDQIELGCHLRRAEAESMNALMCRTRCIRCGPEDCVVVQLLAKLAAEGSCIDLISNGFVLVVACSPLRFLPLAVAATAAG
jgi:hypothetical protein